MDTATAQETNYSFIRVSIPFSAHLHLRNWRFFIFYYRNLINKYLAENTHTHTHTETISAQSGYFHNSLAMQAAEVTCLRINNKVCLISPHIFVCLLRFILVEWIMHVCREDAFTHQQVLATDHMYVEVKLNLFSASRHFNEKHKCSSQFWIRKPASEWCVRSLFVRCEFVIKKFE